MSASFVYRKENLKIMQKWFGEETKIIIMKGQVRGEDSKHIKPAKRERHIRAEREKEQLHPFRFFHVHNQVHISN